MSSTKPARSPRSDNRLPELLDAAARLFARHGYAATSMRDIAVEIKMLPGSLYYHFPSKEDLLLAVYQAGVIELEKAATEAVAKETDPWDRLEAMCKAHLETVLRDSDYAQVLIRVLPDDIPQAADRLRELRDSYEQFFRQVVAQLPLPAGTDRRALRLMLMGALNWAALWFDPDGRDSPRVLARKFVGLVREAQGSRAAA
ncbi:MAG: TetR/AcrR family transcriptional regulator [Comamonadaceae bacterium]|jgi:AcrR family transcriptional regulator|uniref:TetR/AcrR family transcriptional regulator n=1 Tax=Hydrogenophaga borbori TaxID=2294117 RepID=A0A372ELK3_9BURK|nr:MULTISPECIES: TetR/AcrR family transcriptional regulator [Hydrogenophaga]NCT96672.1 TetR/AcrR family transcriptional regulator [Comamonadaceae bacterium]RFP80214.1 TetR/AcrR family transcriptional regulator [Hydrogenophaga borbori]WQB84696.1 TetR/AcrR family transcriptional regulator [Hydrogenophaga sp. SNF1]